jgi:hypothetical protein
MAAEYASIISNATNTSFAKDENNEKRVEEDGKKEAKQCHAI